MEPPIPVGTGTLPQPQGRETTPREHGPAGGCGAILYETSSLNPVQLSPAVSPSVAQMQDTILMTAHNWAARSIDQGQTWTQAVPVTSVFPGADGGVCCNQRVLYVPAADIMVWVLQYAPHSATGENGIRIAVARDRGRLRQALMGSWQSWYVRATNFGFSAGQRLDFPDLAFSDTRLHLALNVLDSRSQIAGSLVVRLDLQELRAGTTLDVSDHVSTSRGGVLTGHSHRLAQGATDTAYFATHVDTTTLRMFIWPDSRPATGVTSVDVTVPAWTDGPYVALTPNGVNWAARHTSRILGGYQNATEAGFMWVSAPQTGRPQCFVRTARIRKSDRTLIAAQDTFSTTYQILYPAATTNQRGDIGCAVAFAGPTHPTTGFFVVDACNPSFAGQTVHPSGPGGTLTLPEWGDSLSLQRHDYYGQSFVGCGQRIVGSGSSNLSRDYAWFGKDTEAPVPVTLTISSGSPVPGLPVPFTIDATDLNGLKDGTTLTTRSFYRRQGYKLSVPAIVSGYAFVRWSLQTAQGTPIRDEPSTTLTVDSIGNGGDRAIAVYRLISELVVDSANPASGVTITSSPTDMNGASSVVTPGRLRYVITNGLFTSATLTAPAVNSSGVPFKRWVVGTSTPTQNPLVVTLIGALHTVRAEYYNRVVGSVQEFGVGCPGTNNVVPRHTSQSTPRVGDPLPFIFSLSSARPNAAAVLFLSRSNTNWLGIPLPIQLGFLGMGTCTLYAAGDVQLGTSMNFFGFGSVPFNIPDDPALIATHLYSQFAVLDPGTATPLQLVLSNALDLLVGGDQ